MTYNLFTYFNEKELLEIRLHELNPVVDKFIICESTYTHAGNKKELNFDINRYSEFKDKIVYLVDENPPNNGKAWDNENHQRDYLINGLSNIKDDDFIMVSDLDEFPSANGVLIGKQMILNNPTKILAYIHKTYYYYINLWALDYRGSMMVTGKQFKAVMENSPQKTRLYQKDLLTINSGWQFSWLGGKNKVAYKFRNFAHQEYNDEKKINEILNKSDKLVDMWDRNLIPQKIDDSFPKYLVDNQEKYKEFIYEKETV